MGLTTSEIKIMAGGGKCRIMCDGQYLSFHGKEPVFIDKKEDGVVYDYVGDNVRGQIDFVKDRFHRDWEAVPA